MSAGPIETERLRLVPATRELIAADLVAAELLAGALEAKVAPDWPPPFHTEELLRRMDETLRDPAAEGWWLHYFLHRGDTRAELIGEGGFKGPPDADGGIEIGYALVPSARGKGFAAEAARGMIAAGWERGAATVRAETLPHLSASIRVMERAGMRAAGSPREGIVAYEVSRPRRGSEIPPG